MKQWLIKLSIILIIIVFIIIFITGIFDKIKLQHLSKATQQLLTSADYDDRIQKATQERQKTIIVFRETIKMVENKELADNLQKQLDDLEKKDNKIFKIKDDRINELTKQLEKNLDAMNKVNKKFGIEPFIMAGLNEKLKPEIFTGGQVKFNFLVNRISLGVGGYVKIYNEFGGGGIISVGINF